jgi:hypothetical protein
LVEELGKNGKNLKWLHEVFKNVYSIDKQNEVERRHVLVLPEFNVLELKTAFSFL